MKIEKVLSVFINGSVKHFTVVWVLEVGDCRNPGLFRPPPRPPESAVRRFSAGGRRPKCAVPSSVL